MIGRPVLFDTFHRGVDLAASVYAVKEGYARDVRNVHHGEGPSQIRKRRGSVVLATPAVQLTSLYGARGVAFLIAAGTTFLYAIDSAGTVTQIASTLTTGLQWSFVEAPVNASQGPVFGMNGVEARETDGTLAGTGAWTANTGTLPIGKYLAYHGNTVWVAGMTSYGSVLDPKSALVWSAPGAARDWPAANVVLLDPGDGDSLQGVGPCGANLIVFKQDKSWLVYDLETGANRPLAENVGCIAHRSIVDTQHGTFFLSRDQGVMLTDGSKVKRVSDKIMPLLEAIPAADRQLASGAFFDGHYYLAVSQGAGTNLLLLEYHVEHDSWWIHSIPVVQLATWETSGEQRLYAPRAADTEVERLFVPGVFADAGVPYSSYWRGPAHTFGSPYLRKRVHAIHFDGSGRIAVRAFKNFQFGAEQLADVDFAAASGLFGGTGDFGGAGTFGGESEVQEAVILTPGIARAWSVEIANATDNDFTVDSYTFFTRDRTR